MPFRSYWLKNSLHLLPVPEWPQNASVVTGNDHRRNNKKDKNKNEFPAQTGHHSFPQGRIRSGALNTLSRSGRA